MADLSPNIALAERSDMLQENQEALDALGRFIRKPVFARCRNAVRSCIVLRPLHLLITPSAPA